MADIMAIVLAGFAAAFVDGALGMGFGPTSSTILLSAGISPVGVSATVNVAKVVTGVTGGLAHWRLGNVDRALVVRLAVPGAIGAAVGAFVLTGVDGDRLRPVLAMLLVLVGVRILVRFRATVVPRPTHRAGSGRGVVAAGAAGGVTNGLIGAWGPVVTPVLLHRGIAPRVVVGSVNTAEIAVAVIAAGTLLGSGGTIAAGSIAAMLVGGVLAAPVAAWSARRVPARALGLAVAALLILTNVRELAGWLELGASRWWGYVAVLVAVSWAAVHPRLARAAAAAPAAIGADR